MPKKDLHSGPGRDEKKGKTQGKDGKRKLKEIFKWWE